MNAGAVIALRQRRAVERFRACGATHRDRARTLEVLAVRRSFAIDSLIRHGVLRSAGSPGYWLDEGAWREHRSRRRKRALWFVLLALVSLGLAYICGS